jgi:hypothetical protein
MEERLQALNETITVSSAVTYNTSDGSNQPPVVGQHGNIVPANKDFYASGDARIPDIIGKGRKKKVKNRRKRK